MITAHEFGLLESFDRLIVRYKGTTRVALVMSRHSGSLIQCRVHRHNKPGWLARPEYIHRDDVCQITRGQQYFRRAS